MNIQELEDKHYEFSENGVEGIQHSKLSIQFAIEMLEELTKGRNFYQPISDKIEELKKYLHENS